MTDGQSAPDKKLVCGHCLASTVAMQILNHLSSSPPRWLKNSFDLAALLWIGCFAWQQAGFLLRDDLYLYGDHPGQFYRLWHLLALIWPEERWIIGWSPYWYAGYPEFQFYPPGFGLLGWLIWLGSFQQLSPVAVYQTLVFVSFVLAPLTLYLLLARGLHDRLAGLAAAWLAMAAPFPLGGAKGVLIGLLGERLAFGLMPLLILSGMWLLQTRRRARLWLVTGFILAWIMVLHPYQAIVPTVVLGLYAHFSGRGRSVRLRWLGLVLLLGFGLTAFWWLPLALRRSFFIPLIEAPLPEIISNLTDMWLPGMAWLLVIAIFGAISRQKERRWLPLAIYLTGAGMLGFILFDQFFLVERLNIFALDPVRLITGVTFSLFMALALGLSELSWLGVRLLRRWSTAAWGLPLLLIVPWLVYGQVAQTFDPARWFGPWQPGPDRGPPIFLDRAEAKYRLSEVWQQMSATPGRVLFTSHYGLLFDIPTSLKAATPYLTGREIIGGTFTHRTPVGSYLWLGQADPPVLRGKVEHRDDQALMGIPWQTMSDEALSELIRRLNVTLIVTTATDRNARAFLDSSARFKPVWSNQLFTFYQLAGYEPAWAEAEQATATVTRYERRAIDVEISEAEPGATLSVKVSNYDLWQAEAAAQPMPIKTDQYGLMQLSLPPGSYTVALRYRPGRVEWLGGIISLATAIGAIGVLVYDGRRVDREISQGK